jgi:hypothetical protein
MKINTIKDEKGDITTDTSEVQKIIWEYFECPYSSKLESQKEINKFIDTYDQ